MPPPPPDELKRVIRDKLSLRALPAQRPFSIVESIASGMICAACDTVIQVPEVECVCTFAFRPALSFHVDCLAEWRHQL